MITPVNGNTAAQTVVQSKAGKQASAASQAAAPTQSRQQAPSDTVQLSSAAQIQQEAVETSVQTVKEAAAGDVQAKRILATEAANHAAAK